MKEKELDLVFIFDIIRIGRDNWIQNHWSLKKIKKLFSNQSKIDKYHWPTVFLNNHDNPRSVSKYGNDKEFRVKSAKLAMLILTQKGTPVLFQGEEIGMTNYEFKSLDQFDDLEVLGNLQKALDSGISKDEYLNHLNCSSRDHSRTTMQWNNTNQGGFSTTDNWFISNKNFNEINVENDLNNSNSILHFYRNLINYRKESHDLIYASYKDVDPDHKNVLYIKEKVRNTLI